jgi:hypothetical protein
MNKVQSFETAEYSSPEMNMGEAYGVIRQIITEVGRDVPSVGMWADMTGDQLRIHYHAYEMFLPTRAKEVEARADEALKNLVSLLKKEFRSRTKKALKLSEQKEAGGSTVEKVSLNERYYYKAWRSYTVSF